MNSSTIISLTSKSSDLSGDYYIKIEQEEYPSDEITLEETAEILDEVYGIDPCIPPEEEETTEEETAEEATAIHEPVLTEEGFVRILDNRIEIDICTKSFSSDFETYVRVYRNDITEPYKLVVPGGTVEEAVLVSETVSEVLVVDGSTSASLSHRPSGDVTTDWVTVIPVSGGAPGLHVDKDNVSWDIKASGSIAVSYGVTYERVRVIVKGEQTLEGEYGKSDAIAFYHGLVDSIELKPPEVKTVEQDIHDRYCNANWSFNRGPWNVTCQREVITEYKCTCGGTTIGYGHTFENRDCPEGVRCWGTNTCTITVGIPRYVTVHTDCGSSTSVETIVNDPEFYKEKCCEYPTVVLPPCRNQVFDNGGGFDIDPEEREFFNSRYASVAYIGVTPSDGCGTTTIRQSLTALNCCDEVGPVGFDADMNPEILPAGESAYIYFSGGKPPYTVRTTNEETRVDGLKVVTVSGTLVRLSSTEEFCGLTSITVTDGCTTDSILVQSDEGQWLPIPWDQTTAEINFMNVEPDSYESAYNCLHTNSLAGVGYSGGYKLVEYMCNYSSTFSAGDGSWFPRRCEGYAKHFTPYPNTGSSSTCYMPLPAACAVERGYCLSPGSSSGSAHAWCVSQPWCLPPIVEETNEPPYPLNIMLPPERNRCYDTENIAVWGERKGPYVCGTALTTFQCSNNYGTSGDWCFYGSTLLWTYKYYSAMDRPGNLPGALYRWSCA